jgi:DegV family protein with EDD domain
MDSVLTWLNDNVLRTNIFFTVGDLVYLKRGGRVSATTAIVGGMLNIKPILKMTSDGAIVNSDKVRGRANSIRYLADTVINRAEDPEKNTCFILHGDCEADALELKSLIEKQARFKDFAVQIIGPVIGTHAGPDTLAVCFAGKARD